MKTKYEGQLIYILQQSLWILKKKLDHFNILHFH